MKLKDLAFYITTLGVSIFAMWYILDQGKVLELGHGDTHAVKVPSGTPFTHILFHNIQSPVTIMLLQICTILLAGFLMGWVCKKVNQPAVVGEMAAGILLGPSFLGYYFPGISGFLFPPQSLGNLSLLSQIGLVLFMFIVGMELDITKLKGKTNAAVMISHASIVAPFTLGVAIAYYTYQQYAPAGVAFTSYALFVGISMSITAFPVLARIIQERGMSKTKLGALAITCAATDDVTAWCMLALVITIVKAASPWTVFYTLSVSVAYILLMFKVVKPLLTNMHKKIAGDDKIPHRVIAICIIVLITSSYITEAIGIHALFGAFIAGTIMPSDLRFRELFMEKIESVALLLLLPLFFVSTGLRTQVGALNTPALWMLCFIILCVAVFAKFGVSALTARYTGQTWKESLQLGALMNTRGLTELVVLNIGYDLGVISQEIFTILVLMALCTTLMTGPALDAINFISRKRHHE